MKKRFTPLLLITTLFILMIGLAISKHTKSTDGYWLWAGITAKDAPPMKDYFIYQGIIVQKHYQHIGLYPHPIQCSHCYLVYRFSSELPDVNVVVETFLKDAAKWQRHHVPVQGIQIDYDSPTNKLPIYADYLIKLRQRIPHAYELNITGLVDWAISGDKNALKLISHETTFIAYQLYNGRRPLDNMESYISALKSYPYPFSVGLLQRFPQTSALKNLKRNSNFQGALYFIQKG